MDGARASMTAMATALMRSAHTRLDRPPLIDDPWGDRLILAAEREAILATAGADDLDAALRAHPAYGAVILRARYSEDALADAVGRGVGQYVIVGAGMDSFALRRPSFAHALQIFEVDHPATQQFKTRRLAEREITLPPGLHLIAVDLSETGLDTALASSSFRSEQPAFFSWLGVTIYLTRQANLATFRAIASSASAGSELVFEYVDQRALDSEVEHTPIQRARARVAAAGEPWISGFHPDQLADELRDTGLELLEDLGAEELETRYCAGRADGLTPSPGAHIARARVAG
jgi:methyltransferase (TIGR00027 family)